MSDNAYKKKMSFTGVIANLVTIGLLIVFWQLGQKWVIAPAAAVLVFLYFFLPKVIIRSEEKFHRKALMMLSTGKAADVPELARRQILLALFGSSAPVDAKLGLAYSQIGDYQAAAECLAGAIPYAPAAELPALQSAYVKALFVTGEAARAEAEGKAMLDQGGPRLAEVLVIVARCRLALGKKGPQTTDLLDEVENLSAGDDVRLMATLTRIEYDIAHGRKAADVPDGADSSQVFLRVWIQMVRGILRERRGHVDDALNAYAKAAKEGREDKCWFANIARSRIEALSGQGHGPAGDTEVDDAIRRKKKRRR